MMTRKTAFSKISGLIGLLCLFQVSSTFGQDKFPISVASKTVGFVPVWAAWKMGYFEREGLAVDLVLMRGAEKAAMALVGESVNVAVGSADAFITAIESNFNVVITAGIINRLDFSSWRRRFQTVSGSAWRHHRCHEHILRSRGGAALCSKGQGSRISRDYKPQPAGPDAERTMGMSAVASTHLLSLCRSILSPKSWASARWVHTLKSFQITKCRCLPLIAVGPSAIVVNSCSSSAEWLGRCAGSSRIENRLLILSRRN